MTSTIEVERDRVIELIEMIAMLGNHVAVHGILDDTPPRACVNGGFRSIARAIIDMLGGDDDDKDAFWTYLQTFAESDAIAQLDAAGIDVGFSPDDPR